MATEKDLKKKSEALLPQKVKPIPILLSLDDADEVLFDAADVIFETKQASVSMLQRKLGIDYAKAARMIDTLEELGVVGPFADSQPREILAKQVEFDDVYGMIDQYLEKHPDAVVQIFSPEA